MSNDPIMQAELEAEYNAKFDYMAEAYGATARDANMAAEDDSTPDGYMTDPAAIYAFVTGGNATFTLVSLKTNTRYTFRVRRAKHDADMFFVSTLVGPNNDDDYAYLGYFIKTPKGPGALRAGKKGNADDVRFRALRWFLIAVGTDVFPPLVEFWHEGRCGRCNRRLTDPASIAIGLGPECATK